MGTATRPLVAVASLAFVVWDLGALLSVAFGWPAQFGGRGDPDNVAGEFVRGTATAPPVYLTIALAELALLAPDRKWWGTLAVVELCHLAALSFVGSQGEALTPPTPDVPEVVLLDSGVMGVLLAAALFLSGVRELVDRRRSEASRPRGSRAARGRRRFF